MQPRYVFKTIYYKNTLIDIIRLNLFIHLDRVYTCRYMYIKGILRYN